MVEDFVDFQIFIMFASSCLSQEKNGIWQGYILSVLVCMRKMSKYS